MAERGARSEPGPNDVPARWRNRIVGYGEEAPERLLANPNNWRIHPLTQQQALLDVLRRIGIVAPVIVNRATGFVVDGHLRVALAIADRIERIPVSYVELTAAEELEMLATFDPITYMARVDKAAYEELIRRIDRDMTAEAGSKPPRPGGLDGARADPGGSRMSVMTETECSELLAAYRGALREIRTAAEPAARAAAIAAGLPPWDRSTAAEKGRHLACGEVLGRD